MRTIPPLVGAMSLIVDGVSLEERMGHFCAYHRKPVTREDGTTSCLATPYEIQVLVRRFNRHYPETPIKKNMSHSQILQHLTKVMSECNDVDEAEMCAVLTLGIRELALLYKPQIEWTPASWLSSDDIENVLVQVEKAHADTKLIGIFPADICNPQNQFWVPRCKKAWVKQHGGALDIKELSKQMIFKLMYVFNTDLSIGGGKHWISLFVDIKKKRMYFYDSNMEPPPNLIQKYIDTLISHGKKCQINFKLERNMKQNQYADGQCGPYVIRMLTGLVEGYNFKDLWSKFPNDEEMQDYRRSFFRLVQNPMPTFFQSGGVGKWIERGDYLYEQETGCWKHPDMGIYNPKNGFWKHPQKGYSVPGTKTWYHPQRGYSHTDRNVIFPYKQKVDAAEMYLYRDMYRHLLSSIDVIV